MMMKRMKTAAVAAAIAAVTAMGAAPAQAGAVTGAAAAAAGPGTVCDIGSGALYICEYGVTQRDFPGGVEQFIIGSDYAVWTRWFYIDNPVVAWSDWTSLGGVARSEVFLEGERDNNPDFTTRMTIVGSDGRAWQRVRPNIGAAWTGWDLAPKMTV